MKKMTALILALSCAIALCACSEQKPAETEAAPETTEAEAATTAAADGAAGTTDIDTINKIVEGLNLTEPDVMGSVSKLGEYTGLEITTSEPVKKTMEDAEAYLKDYVLPNYTEEVKDAIKDGDTANIDYEGKKDGVAFDGGTSAGYDLVIGSGSFIDGFEAGLVGHKAGETVDLNLTFPENYGNTELAGQDVVFTVKINTVTRVKELTDALAAEINDKCATVKELKDMTLQYLQEEEDLLEKEELYYNAVQQVIEKSEIVPDDAAVEYTTNNYIISYVNSMKDYGIDLGTLLSYYGSTYEEFRDSYDEYSIENIKQRVVLEEIAKKENLEVTDEAIEKFAEEYGYTKDTIRDVISEKLINQLVLEELANQFIIDHSTVTYTEEAAEE